MEEKSGKILVNLMDQFSRQQVFWGVWLLIIGLFLWGAVRFFSQRNQRNFREVPYKRPSSKPSSKAVVPTDSASSDTHSNYPTKRT